MWNFIDYQVKKPKFTKKKNQVTITFIENMIIFILFYWLSSKNEVH